MVENTSAPKVAPDVIRFLTRFALGVGATFGTLDLGGAYFFDEAPDVDTTGHDGDGRTRAGGLSTPMSATAEPTEPRRRHRRKARENEAAKRLLERDVERDNQRGPRAPALQQLARRTGDCSSSRGGVRSGCWRLQSGLQGTTGGSVKPSTGRPTCDRSMAAIP